MNFRSTSEDLNLSTPVDTHVSESVVTHAWRTGSTVHLANPSRDPRFHGDAYLQAKDPRTVLCLPFADGEDLAALYIERVVGRGFTPEQIEVANLLARPAATAIGVAESYEHELRSLQSRLDSQFLHNTFSVIAQLVVENPQKAEAALLMLSKVHRYVFEAPVERLVVLTEELDICRDFLALEQHRLGERLHVEIAVEGRVDRVHIPALILQPLIESSIRYGSARKMGRSCVRVSATVDDRLVRLTVSDDGPGWDSAGEGREAGVRDVTQRLAHFYAEGQSVQVHKSDGVTVAITLPRKRSQGEE